MSSTTNAKINLGLIVLYLTSAGEASIGKLELICNYTLYVISLHGMKIRVITPQSLVSSLSTGPGLPKFCHSITPLKMHCSILSLMIILLDKGIAP